MIVLKKARWIYLINFFSTTWAFSTFSLRQKSTNTFSLRDSSSGHHDQKELSHLGTGIKYEGRLDEGSGGYRCGFVSIIGAANMGKSTMMNSLLQEELCIATNRPQTTRHAILGLLTTDDCQVCLVDTPGVIEDPAYKLQEGMMEAVVSALHDADVLLVVTDIFSTPIPNDTLFRRIQATQKPVLVAINKVDLASKVNITAVEQAFAEGGLDKTVTAEQAVWRWRQYLPECLAIIPCTASNGLQDPGVGVLQKLLIGGPGVPEAFRSLGRPIPGMFRQADTPFLSDEEARELLPLSPPLYDREALTDRTERFVASEMIRAALFESLKKELPYCCEVLINSFQEPKERDEKEIIRIDATIVVERDSQKLIVIGKGGQKIKQVGTVAREKLETFLQSKVFLNLTVKVNKDWRKREEALKEYGYY